MATIILYGMRGSGKTTIGRLLAEKLGYTFYDLDTVMEKDLGIPVREYVGKNGWEAFREQEFRSLSQILLVEEEKIISLGGGTVIFERNRNLLKLSPNNILIFIDCPIVEISERIRKDQQNGKGRNSLTGKGIIEELEYLYEERMPYYSSLYNYIFMNTQTPEECAKDILETINL